MESTFKSPFRAPSTPAGALAAAAVAALLAGVLVFSALKAAKDEEGTGAAAGPSGVVVANRMIPKGTHAEAVASSDAIKSTKVDAAAVVDGAITDVSALRGQIAAHDILPGQQIASGDFTATEGKTLVTNLSRDARAISIPLDASHGMIGDAQPGDRVDIFASFGSGNNGDVKAATTSVLKPLASNVLVLDAPNKLKSSRGGDPTDKKDVVTLRLGSRMAAKVAFTSDNGKLWMVLRPAVGAPRVNTRPVTLRDVLAGGGFYIVAKQGIGASARIAASRTTTTNGANK